MGGRTTDPVTVDLVREWAEGTLEEWFDGMYTDNLADGRQRLVKRWSDRTYVVRDHKGYRTDRKFRVRVIVEEVE